MSRVTTYIDPETEAKARDAAKAEKISLSKWIARLIGKEVADEWPESVRKLAGAWADFPDLHEIREGLGEDVSLQTPRPFPSAT
jgi:hypothetical protein